MGARRWEYSCVKKSIAVILSVSGKVRLHRLALFVTAAHRDSPSKFLVIYRQVPMWWALGGFLREINYFTKKKTVYHKMLSQNVYDTK